MFFDLHNDFPTSVPMSEYGEFASVGVVVGVIWTDEFKSDGLSRTIEITDNLTRAGIKHIAVEDLGFLSECDPNSFDFSKYAYCSLTWNAQNAFAGGALCDGTLTRYGRDLIRIMNGKCAVDVAHLNKRSFYEVLNEADRVLCSHTGFAEHPRALDGEQVKLLIARNAVIGLCAVTAFTGANTVDELAQVIDDFIQRYDRGIDALCLGTDFYGTSDLPKGFTNYSDLNSLRDLLAKRGYSATDTDKIFFGNATRFFEEQKSERHL